MPIQEELTDDAIVQSVLNPQEVQETESDEEDSPMTQISWAEPLWNNKVHVFDI